jgi:hypothetical protein
MLSFDVVSEKSFASDAQIDGRDSAGIVSTTKKST